MSAREFETRLHALLPEGVSVAPFLRFREDVLRFNRGRNLVSRKGGAELVERLVLESAGAAGVLDLHAGERILDLGTGAGFPGIPFALARPVPCVLTLLDRRPVACDFLRREILELELEGVEVLEGQSQDLLTAREDLAASFDTALLKAVAPTRQALRLARPFLGPRGRVVLFRDLSFDPSEQGLPAGSGEAERWWWEGAAPLPGFHRAEDAPALQTFRRRD